MRKLLKLITFILLLYVLYINIDLLKSSFIDFKKTDIKDIIYTENINDITLNADPINDDTKLNQGLSGNTVYVDSDFYIYYTFLSENEKVVYRQIYANADKLNTTFIPESDIYENNLEKTLKAFYFDHPEFFWLGTEFSYKYDETNLIKEVTLGFNDTINYIEEAKNNFNNVVNSIVNEANSLPNIIDKEKFVHDKIINLVEYDTASMLNQSAYSALVLNRSVCAGYAKAFQCIMTKLGIPTYYVTGYSEGDHAWNMVNLGGHYYNVDVTWDDAAMNKYKFFNKSDNEFSSDHTRNNDGLLLPSCA